MRSVASAVVTSSSGAAMSTHTLTSGLSKRRAELERGDRDRPEHERGHGQQDVVLLERRRRRLGDAARREAPEARRERRLGGGGERGPVGGG